jgi:hypothetical protein
VSAAELGWTECSGLARLKFDVGRSPFANARLRLRLDLTDNQGETRYHSLEDAVAFVVTSPDTARGLVRLEGRWSLVAQRRLGV